MALNKNIDKYKQSLLESWESVPPYFITSSSNGIGREELLEYIDSINSEVNKS
jgi:GTP-binding protein